MAEIPSGAPLVKTVTGATGVLTADGVTHPLTPAGSYVLPPSMSQFNFAGPTGGSYFLFDELAIGEPSQSVLRVSRDQGRTWQAARLPAGIDTAFIVGADDGWIYAAATDSGGGTFSHIIASSDGGLTWRLVDQPD